MELRSIDNLFIDSLDEESDWILSIWLSILDAFSLLIWRRLNYFIEFYHFLDHFSVHLRKGSFIDILVIPEKSIVEVSFNDLLHALFLNFFWKCLPR